MPTNYIDINATMTTYPYVAPVIGVPTIPQGTAISSGSSSTDQAEALLNSLSNTIQNNLKLIANASNSTPSVGSSSWKKVSTINLPFVKNTISFLNKSVITPLSTLVSLLEKILKIVQLFISTFNSFSQLLLAVINYAQSLVDQYATSALDFGFYAAAFAPPAFYKKAKGVNDFSMSRGGFNGFITRLQSSLDNTKDNNRPVFGNFDIVGGWVILIDSETLDDVMVGLDQLSKMFDFMKLFGLNLTPPPPTNLRGTCGEFQQGSATAPSFGVKIEWDNNYIASAYNIYRSQVQGGIETTYSYTPTNLMDNKDTGEVGLITVMWDNIENAIASISGSSDHINVDALLPEKTEGLYNDPQFNNGHPVTVINTGGPSLNYIDQFFTAKSGSNGIDQITTVDLNGNTVPLTQVFYVIKSTVLPPAILEGPKSIELDVTIKTCNDVLSTANTIPQSNGRFEFLSAGIGQLNSWTSIHGSAMLPWFKEIIKVFDKMFDSLRGMVTNASKAFSQFLNDLAKRIEFYVSIINTMVFVVNAFEKFLLGPSISFLVLPPATGGMDTFVQRIQNARQPAGQKFSGPEGVSIGVVITYGVGAGSKAIATEMGKAISFIVGLLT
jgi:hypothetical protein